MRRFFLTLLLLPTAVALSAQAAAAATQAGQKPRVYLDCPNDFCDTDFFVTEIPYVDFIRERTDAHVHLLVTSLENGSGGTAYTLAFIGLGRQAGRADTIVTNVPPNSSQDDRRKELARVFKLGLVRYLVTTEAGAHLQVNYDGPAAGKDGAAKAAGDPWNYWVYRIGGNSNFGGESESRRASFSGNVSARRTTEDLKVSLAGSGSYRESRYSFSDGTESFFALRNYDGSFRLVKSYGPHWSAGINAGVGSSDFTNQKFSANALASAEYNFFPWSEATRNQLVAIYAVGARHFQYKETTIYFETEETRPQHQVVLAATSKQPWGSVDLQANFSQYLHDATKNNAGIFGSVDLRLSKGFSLSLFASASQVRLELVRPLPSGLNSWYRVTRPARSLVRTVRCTPPAKVVWVSRPLPS